jgi:hypothetical protein
MLMRALLLGLAGVLVLGGSVAGAARTQLLDESTDDAAAGPNVTVVDFMRRPRIFRIEVEAVPHLPLSENSDIEISCENNGRERDSEISLAGRTPPVRVKFDPLFLKADECFVDATAAYEDPEASGSLTMRLFGQKRPVPKRGGR